MSDARIEIFRRQAREHLRRNLDSGMRAHDGVRDAVDRFYDQIESLTDDAEEVTDQLETELWQQARAPEGTGRGSSPAVRREPRPQVADESLTSPFRFVTLNDVVVPAELEAVGARLDRP